METASILNDILKNKFALVPLTHCAQIIKQAKQNGVTISGGALADNGKSQILYLDNPTMQTEELNHYWEITDTPRQLPALPMEIAI